MHVPRLEEWQGCVETGQLTDRGHPRAPGALIMGHLHCACHRRHDRIVQSSKCRLSDTGLRKRSGCACVNSVIPLPVSTVTLGCSTDSHVVELGLHLAGVGGCQGPSFWPPACNQPHPRLLLPILVLLDEFSMVLAGKGCRWRQQTTLPLSG